MATVNTRIVRTLSALVWIVWAPYCISAELSNGRVLDQETGTPIANAVVIGQYVSSRGFHATPTCNRVETTVSDQDGGFSMPIDASSGSLQLAAFHPKFVLGRPIRIARSGAGGNPRLWEVLNLRYQNEYSNAEIVSIDSRTFSSEASAKEASGELRNVILRRADESPAKQLQDLSTLLAYGICNGGPRTSDGATVFIAAILAEQIRLGAGDDQVAETRAILARAKKPSVSHR